MLSVLFILLLGLDLLLCGSVPQNCCMERLARGGCAPPAKGSPAHSRRCWCTTAGSRSRRTCCRTGPATGCPGRLRDPKVESSEGTQAYHITYRHPTTGGSQFLFSITGQSHNLKQSPPPSGSVTQSNLTRMDKKQCIVANLSPKSSGAFGTKWPLSARSGSLYMRPGSLAHATAF